MLDVISELLLIAFFCVALVSTFVLVVFTMDRFFGE
jgi:hypothetical protein